MPFVYIADFKTAVFPFLSGLVLQVSKLILSRVLLEGNARGGYTVAPKSTIFIALLPFLLVRTDTDYRESRKTM